MIYALEGLSIRMAQLVLHIPGIYFEVNEKGKLLEIYDLVESTILVVMRN